MEIAKVEIAKVEIAKVEIAKVEIAKVEHYEFNTLFISSIFPFTLLRSVSS